MLKVKSVLLAVVLVLGVLTPQPAAASQGWAGHLLSAEPLPANLWLPNTGNAYRVRYGSTGADGRPTVVSGAIFVPVGVAPVGGWPVVAWAHGTVGIADGCAPSTNVRSQRDIDYLQAWLAAGYAIVATDYEGLGTPGLMPYENGSSAAHNVIDIVRASHRADSRLARRWLAVGQSEGAQASMFTGALVRSYAPELDYRGSIATGMPSQWRTIAEVAHVFDPAAPAIPEVLLIISGLAAVHPAQIRPADYLTPLGQDLLAKSRTSFCYDDLAAQFAGRTNGDLFAIDAAERRLVQCLLDRDAEIPVKPYGGPVFIGQGVDDRVVYPPASQTTAERLVAAGNDVTLKFYPGADHDTTLAAALPDLLAWAAEHTH